MVAENFHPFLDDFLDNGPAMSEMSQMGINVNNEKTGIARNRPAAKPVVRSPPMVSSTNNDTMGIQPIRTDLLYC